MQAVLLRLCRCWPGHGLRAEALVHASQGLVYGTGPKHASDEEEALLPESGKV